MSNQDYPASVLIVKNITGAQLVKETHISYAVIADDYVYKIKKPVDFGFLDYRLAKSRKMYSMLEKDLNDRFSKNIYIDVLKIVRQNEKDFALVPLTNSLAAIEYVLKMKRIKDEDFLQARIEKGLITVEDMQRIGRQTAELFKNLEPAPKDEEFDTHFDVVKFNAVENFTQTEKYVSSLIDKDFYEYIKSKTLDFLENNKEIFIKRAEDGFIKNGHGDLRLEHIYFNDDNTVGLIDCIEFNKRFRFNDVISEASFLSMELDSMGRLDLADGFLSGFLSVFNDETSLKLINYYRCYLSYVRAKVTCFLVDGKDKSWELYDTKVNEIKKLIDMSLFYAKSMERNNLIFFGFMGTGKSKNAAAFAKRFPAALFVSDIIRKQSEGLNVNDRQYIEWGTGIYSAETSIKLYDKLGALVEEKHKTGRMSIVDASFTKKEYLETYKKHNVGNIIFLEFDAPKDVILARLAKREQSNTVTDGRIEIAEKQRETAEMPKADLKIITTGSVDNNIEEIIKFLIK